MIKRVITAIWFAVVIVLCILLQGWAMRALLLFSMVVSMREMYQALSQKGSHPLKWVGYFYCVMSILLETVFRMTGFTRINPQLTALLLSALVGMSAVILLGHVDYDRFSSTLIPLFYPGFLFSLMMTMQNLNNRFASLVAMVLMFFVASVNDVAALFIGMRFGKHRLSPEISPKKSKEGSIAGLIAAMLFAMLVPAVLSLIPFFNPEHITLAPIWAFALLGLGAGALSQIGDLTASLVKRYCGIKDFGTIFPGHGGMMDRMDGILFCSAACWLFFKLFGY